MISVDTLLAAAEKVDVLDAAGRIIANPRRHAPEAPAAEVLALAYATEKLNAVFIETELLVRALKLPMTGNDRDEDFRDHAIQTQIDTLSRLFSQLRGTQQIATEQEKTDGNG